ncbi:histidine kinase [Amycolatopsis sp. NBC_00345]|uniref:sensor histidine kinase n=1 Tax=Amycolatopsis sp. NBC_00345 TaxID=2975955 RepID=UPI002E26D2FB
MRTVERAGYFVAAVEVGFPLSLLAWRFSLRQESPELAAHLDPVTHILPFLVIPLVILVWASLRRLRRGLPSWRWTVAVLAVQLAVTVASQHGVGTTILMLLLGCTILVTVPAPYSWPLAGVTIAVGVVLNWQLPWLSMLGLLLHNLMIGAVIYTVVRMGEFAIALRRAQDQLAGFAVVQERTRVSRDLHDTLGQQLTAIGLRAELAARLMTAAPGRAAGELRAVQQMTEESLADVRRVARGSWQPVFEDELTTGTALLESAGVRCRVSAGADPAEPTARAAAWALREGITNVLKHSSARTCVLNAELRDGVFRLLVENDGVRDRAREAGCGLTGITERVTKLGGTVRFGPAAGGRFRLAVEIPDGQHR